MFNQNALNTFQQHSRKGTLNPNYLRCMVNKFFFFAKQNQFYHIIWSWKKANFIIYYIFYYGRTSIQHAGTLRLYHRRATGFGVDEAGALCNQYKIPNQELYLVNQCNGEISMIRKKILFL